MRLSPSQGDPHLAQPSGSFVTAEPRMRIACRPRCRPGIGLVCERARKNTRPVMGRCAGRSRRFSARPGHVPQPGWWTCPFLHDSRADNRRDSFAFSAASAALSSTAASASCRCDRRDGLRQGRSRSGAAQGPPVRHRPGGSRRCHRLDAGVVVWRFHRRNRDSVRPLPGVRVSAACCSDQAGGRAPSCCGLSETARRRTRAENREPSAARVSAMSAERTCS